MEQGHSTQGVVSQTSFSTSASTLTRDRPPSSIDVDQATGRVPSPETVTSSRAPTACGLHDDAEKEIAPVLLKQQLGANISGPLDVEEDCGRDSKNSWRISTPPLGISLPQKRHQRILRGLRHSFLAVYQRLFTLTLLANLTAWVIVLVAGLRGGDPGPSPSNLATATAANVTAAILIRQEYVINALYIVCCWTPHSWPLAIRRRVAKLYEFGGVHSGCAVSSLLWFITSAAFMTRDFARGTFQEPAVIAITYVLLSLFLAICIFAIPKFRFMSHNTFEAVHRFAGWLAVALFWVNILLVLRAQSKTPGSESLGMLVLKAPTFWLLVIITFSIVLPWLRLRKVNARPEVLSNHATRIHMDYTTVGTVFGIRLALNPLKEWHAFATIPAADGQSFSLIVSNAGDWTKDQIQNPRHQYWVRGIPVAGVLRMALVFRRVVVVTTGSGIGPCLSMLIKHPMPCRVLWSTPNPLQTYGSTIMDAVHQADPDAMIINTRATGRPDMVSLTYHLYRESQAEAVFVISNPKLTRKVVYGMESRGIPAYGPVWDS